MDSQLWTCPLQIVYMCRTYNLVDVASAAENLVYTTMSVPSGLISHYPGFWIGGCAFPCIFQSPIYFPTVQRLSRGVAYLC